jgi:tetratricopeptide (TPR) repeat protein
VLDKNHPDLATSYNNLALIYQDLKDYESAANFGEKAVTILQHLFPNGHPDLDLYKRNLEGIREKRKGEAEKKRSEEVKKMTGRGHFLLVSFFNFLCTNDSISARTLSLISFDLKIKSFIKSQFKSNA